MEKFKLKIKQSYFYVNNLHLFVIFISLVFVDFTLAMYYSIVSLIIYIGKVFTSKLPIHPSKSFSYKTYTYKKAGKVELKMDIWYPGKDFRNEYPLVFFCHGGGWISGFRNQPNNVSWCKYLASKGFCVASIDYRYGFKNSMEDILADYGDALNYVKKNSKSFKIDKENIVLMGLSAGGHLSLLYSTYNSYVENEEKMYGIKGAVVYYAPSDLNDMFISESKSIFAKFSTKRTLKAIPSEKKEIYDYYSPISWVSQRMVPCLVVHGKLDTVVPFNSSRKLVKELNKYNVSYTFLVHKKGGHSFDTHSKDLTTVNILEKTARYIKKLTYKY